MKNDIDATRRKLTNSASHQTLRHLQISNQPRTPQHIFQENNRNELNRMIRYEKSEPLLNYPQNSIKSMQTRNPPVPEESDFIISQLHSDLNSTRRELQHVQQTHNQVDNSALIRANQTISYL